jgi:hypothetical protein
MLKGLKNINKKKAPNCGAFFFTTIKETATTTRDAATWIYLAGKTFVLQ